jgi:hypothetical protein
MLKKRRKQKRRPEKQMVEMGMGLLLVLKMSHQNLFLMNQIKVQEMLETRTVKRTQRDLGLLLMKILWQIRMLQKK